MALTGCTSSPSGATPAGPPPPSLEVLDVSGDLSTTVTFCDHGNRVYRTQVDTLGVALTVVPADPTCAGGPS